MIQRTSASKSYVAACLLVLTMSSLPGGMASAKIPAHALEARDEATARQAFEHGANRSDEDRVKVRFAGAASTTSGAPCRDQLVSIFPREGDLVVEAEAFPDLVAYRNIVDDNEARPDVGGR